MMQPDVKETAEKVFGNLFQDALKMIEVLFKQAGVKNPANEAKLLGANGIAVACPLCHANLDGRQEEIERMLQFGTTAT